MDQSKRTGSLYLHCTSLEYRGLGLGRKLLEHAMAKAKGKSGSSSLTADMTDGHEDALKLYQEKVGFRFREDSGPAKEKIGLMERFCQNWLHGVQSANLIVDL